ncbi:hypothetical protein CR513_07355, partial [Mucuna pruriens]
MRDEYATLLANETWFMFSLPLHRKGIGFKCTWFNPLILKCRISPCLSPSQDILWAQKSSQGLFISMLIYVDDIIITSSSIDLISYLITKFNLLESLDYFLGVEVKHLSIGSLLLIQPKYI